MILLDTDHISVLRMPVSERQSRLLGRMARAAAEAFAVPVVAVEETMRRWLAAMARERQASARFRLIASWRACSSSSRPF